jgi:hypothetical protein
MLNFKVYEDETFIMETSLCIVLLSPRNTVKKSLKFALAAGAPPQVLRKPFI